MTPPESPIIIVEDNLMDGEMARRAVQKMGAPHPVVLIEDGLRAVDQLLGNRLGEVPPLPHPKLVIIDVNLPGLGGIEVLSRLRASDRHKHTIVVMVSSSAEPEDVLRSYRMGCNSYVTKPVNNQNLFYLYMQVAHYWTSTNLTPDPQDP